MELKVACDCGQKYKFDVEPVHGRMPFPVNCPACGVDGTSIANGLLAQMPPSAVNASMPAPVPVATFATAAPAPVAAAMMPAPAASAPAPAGLRINRAAAPPPPIAPPIPAPAAMTTATVTRAPAVPKYMQTNAATSYNSFLLGIVGAFLGAAVAVGFMVGMHAFLGFSFPLFGTIMGAIIGFGARLMYRGTDSTLGGMSAAVAFVTIGATLYLMFGILGIAFSLMSLVIGVAAAFKIASG